MATVSESSEDTLSSGVLLESVKMLTFWHIFA